MRLWFDHSSEVTLHEQIVTQMRLGILSGELSPGERLPSIRDLARRFHIHANTVSAAYQQLQRESWVVGRRGSGIYARLPTSAPADASDLRQHALDHAIDGLLRTADSLGVPRSELRVRLLRALSRPERTRPLLIEPDPELRAIVAWELAAGLECNVNTCTVPMSELKATLLALDREVLPVCLPSKAEAVRAALKDGTSPFVLEINPVAAILAQHLPKSREGLIGIASSWPLFRGAAKTMLVAAGYPAEALVLRDAAHADWQLGLEQTDALICDSLTASRAAFHKRVLAFPLVAEVSIRGLRLLRSNARHPPLPNRSLREVP